MTGSGMKDDPLSVDGRRLRHAPRRGNAQDRIDAAEGVALADMQRDVGNMGAEGSVAFQFQHCGQLIFAPGTSEDRVMEVALEAGAEDVVTHDDGVIEVLSSVADFEAVKNALQTAGLVAEEAAITMRAQNTIELEGDDAVRMQKLLDVLEDLDDTQEIFHNAAL